MTALEKFSPAAISVVKAFAYALRSAPTADLVAWGVNELNAGLTLGQFENVLFNHPVPQSPFTVYGVASTNAAFCAALVDNFCVGTTIASGVKAGWTAELVLMLPQYPSRGDFAVAIGKLVDDYAGADANLLTLKAALAVRAEQAAAFAQSPAGAVYNGQGFAQLLEPLLPPPTYTLSASSAAIDEGSAVTFRLQTTYVAPGTSVAYSLGGTGITAADVVGGQMSGALTIDATGLATVVVVLAADTKTEGAETLRLELANALGHQDVLVRDTSVDPPLLPTYVLSRNVPAQNEGGSIAYTLTTTQVAAGTTLAYTLSGIGITAADIAGGVLSGFFTIDAQGLGSATVGLVADASTEGSEQLRLQLINNAAQIDTLVNDTSLTPAPTGSPDVLIIADAMDNSRARVPGSALEGELAFNSYLNVDLLDQRGVGDVRMTVSALKASNPVAGAALDLTNQSADRGNLAQVSNQSLFSFDLGLQIDRVDYSAETGKIVAVVSTEAAADTLWVIVNDNGVDNHFAGATDRIDTLKNVEEVVASAGGGVIDLTSSGRDWVVTFSRNFNSASDVDAARDRATHRVELLDALTGVPNVRSFIEYRDADASAALSQTTAAWTQVQGSDRNETLVFTSAQSLDARTNVLRGGANSVKFNELTRSILSDVALLPWVPSTNLADDGNATGLITVTTIFTDGDGSTPLSANTNVTSSHTPDNNVAAGSLKVFGSQDAEDAVSFTGSAQPKAFVLGQSAGGVDSVSVRLVSGPAAPALELFGFEFLRDNGASDDFYRVASIFKATQGGPKLVDGVGNDHDTVQLADEALGSAAVGGAIGVVNLSALNGAAPGFGVDFDVLDLSALTVNGLSALGTVGTDDELVLGKLASLTSALLFEAIVLSNASTDKGTVLTLDLDAAAVKAGATTLFTFTGSAISAGGLVFNTPGQASAVAQATIGFNITVVDTTAGPGATVWGGAAADLLTGGAGNDVLRGFGGNDTLDGGVPGGNGSFTETWAFTITGTPDAVAAAANRITLAMTIDGTALTLTEAAVADTVYGDGNGAVVDGAASAVIGVAMAGLINANLASINAGPGTGTVIGASFDVTSGTVLLSFLAGYNANDTVTFVLNSGAGPDGGNFVLSAGVNVNGGNGGSDTFVFERTAAANGHDTLQNFTPASDKLDFREFAGAAIAAAGVSINAAAGGTLAGVATTAEFVYNAALGVLSASNFSVAAAAGKLVLAEGAKSVVAVTADPTGARGDAANTRVSLYYVENGPAAGLDDLSVALVGTISGPVELTLAEIFGAMT